MKRIDRFGKYLERGMRSLPAGGIRRGRGRRWLGGVLTSLALLALAISLAAAGPARPFPASIPLPNGFQPEGIASGQGTNFYVGSLVDGAIFHGNLRTGEGEVLVSGQTGLVSVGMWVDARTNHLYVSGGPTGLARVYNAGSGAEVASFPLTAPGTFINDVVVTGTAAYFTDSFRPFLYRVPLNEDGSLPDPPVVEEVPLGGDFEFIAGGFNANGIDATPDGAWLVVVNSTVGDVYRVDPATGEATRIDLAGGSVPNGDGILLDGGKTLYVVQNANNQIAEIKLAPDLTSGEIVQTITTAEVNFRVPTTIAEFGNWLYAVNARFDTPPTPDTEYEAVQVGK
jgi:sugar lactone lactonase YvrE